MKSNLIYTGKLSIKLGKKRRKLYNTGHHDLFRLFASAMIGKHDNNSTPDTFLITNSSGEKIITIPIEKTALVDNDVTARYSGYLATAIDSNLTSVKIKLVKSSNQNILLDFAEITIDDDNLAILKSITNEKSALLEWDLTVSNKGVQK